tara:strand:+ start:713 stop:970 length:258 start_codon:yes stop_codon:yes gene_type:complete
VKYKYKITEESVDIRHFEILSDKLLEEEDILNAMCLVDIGKEGDTGTDEGVRTTYQYTEYGEDSKVNYHREVKKPMLKLLDGGKS